MLTADFTPTNEQAGALRDVANTLLHTDKPVLTLCGAAGTGKTSLMFFLASLLREKGMRIGWCAPTGKAAARLSERTGEEVKTIHSMVYRSVVTGADGQPKFGDVKDVASHGKVWICDEASMVDRQLGKHLRQAISGTGGRLLYVGDREQLPPIRGTWDANFDRPDAVLETVHRQAKDNPILRIATDLREGRILQLPRETIGDSYAFLEGSYGDAAQWVQTHAEEDAVLLCYTNKDRMRLNNMVRLYMGRATGPVLDPRERFVVLTNNPMHQVMNGEVFELRSVTQVTEPGRPGSDEGKLVELDWEGKRTRDRALVHLDTVGGDSTELSRTLGIGAVRRSWLHIDYGYALTVHKMQGSEAAHVGLLFSDGAEWAIKKQREEAKKRGENPNDYLRRWMYTALTRGKTSFRAYDVRTRRSRPRRRRAA